MEKKNKFLPTSFRIPPELKKRLKVATAELDTDSSAVVIEGIEEWLAENEGRAMKAREARESAASKSLRDANRRHRIEMQKHG